MLKRYHADSTNATTFAILPAIDIRGGRVVRLRQGDFDAETPYGDDPVAVAEAFAAEGATWLHIVDLDGARQGRPVQTEAIGPIVARVGQRVRCEVAGGLRSEEAVGRALATGATRVVVGTAALRDQSFAARIVERHGPERVAAAIDVRDGRALGDGWRRGAPGLSVGEAIERLAAAGVTTFEVTAIDRDGLLGGPDLELLSEAVGLGLGDVIASGGIASVDDLRAVRAVGCRGAIVGRALYERRLSLERAIAALQA